VEIPGALGRNAVAAWGADGQRFLDELPSLLDSVTRDWGLTVLAPYPMSFHWVCSVQTAEGGHAVLKLGPPGHVDVGGEVAALGHFGGAGAVRLLAHDVARGAMLLEQAVPGTPASALVPSKDIIATAAIITVMRRLHRPVAGAGPLPELHARDRRSFVEHLARYPGDSPIPRRLVTRASGLLDDLSGGGTERVVLHGDLHHDNVLRASREPWLAIDPHGVVGDPGADVGAMLYNPDPPNRDPSLVALVPARIEQLADGLGMDSDRVVAWAFEQAVLSEVWTAEEPGAPVTRALDVALLLEPRLA
jgi:streptomycin 6-kinase